MQAAANDCSSETARKRRRGDERIRVTRACDRCKKRKIKCNGKQPCELCLRTKASCTFDAVYARGRPPSIPPASDVEPLYTSAYAVSHARSHSASGQEHRRPTSEVVPRMSGAHSSDLRPLDAEHSNAANVMTSLQASPEPCQTDFQGHYIGPASGVSFLIKIQKRLDEAISFSDASNIFSFGDAPLQLPDSDPTFCLMLPQTDAQRLIDRYFDFAMPTYRFLHRPTIQAWFIEFYETLGIMRDPHSAPAKLGLLFLVFAQARVYMPESDSPGPADLSLRYYLAAERQLNKERGSISLTSVQARLLQCMYLLTQSRINHCWSLFGTVSRLAYAIGLNRKDRWPGSSNRSDKVDIQCRRRTFWSAFTLDTFLSAALGRPQSFDTEEIDNPLPDEDDLLTGDDLVSNTPKGQSIMLAPIAHIKIARIISTILRNLYSIKSISANRRVTLVDNAATELSEWRSGLARFLDPDYLSSSLLIPIYQRQKNVLNLTYWHALLLAYRPFLLNSPARHAEVLHRVSQEDSQMMKGVGHCLSAAMNTVHTIEEMTQEGQIFRSFWITAYFGFTATIMLYMYALQKRGSPSDSYSAYLSAAVRCQSHLWAIAEKGSLSERYCLVLEELRAEAVRPIEVAQNWAPSGPFGHRTQQQDLANPQSAMNAAHHTNADYIHTMNDSSFAPDMNMLADAAGWDQFASMISSGLGNLDVFLSDSLI